MSEARLSLPAVFEDAAQDKQEDDADDLASEDDPVEIDGGLPAHVVSFADVDAGRLGAETETSARARSALAVVRCPTFTSAAARASADRRGRNDGDPVALVGFAEHPLYRQGISGLLH